MLLILIDLSIGYLRCNDDELNLFSGTKPATLEQQGFSSCSMGVVPSNLVASIILILPRRRYTTSRAIAHWANYLQH